MINKKIMTASEIILITIIWISYGVFNMSQFELNLKDDFGLSMACIIFSPVILIGRIIVSIFYKFPS